MKRIGALLLLTVGSYSLIAGGMPFTTCASATGDPFATIRVQYAAINKNLKRYRVVDKDLPGYSAEGGSLIAYFEGAAIKKIHAQFYGEMGRVNEDYYYWKNQLIFIFRTEYTYSEPLSGKVVSTKESRFYFDKGLMIRWLDEQGRQVSSSNADYKAKQDEYLKTSKELTILARAPEPKGHGSGH